METRKGTRNRRTAVTLLAAAAMLSATLLTTACGSSMNEKLNSARDAIAASLKGQGLWHRGHLPIENPPTPEQIKGLYDVVEGAYRYVVNERRENRAAAPEIAEGDSIRFYFDARVFTGGTFESSTTFYTNMEERIDEIRGSNDRFSPEFWPTEQLKIKLGNDPRILKSLQRALISCRAGDGNPKNDDQPEGVASDRVRVYLTSDIAFGTAAVYGVPARSTIVFEITEIEIIK